MKVINKILFILSFINIFHLSEAQITFPYFCGFEDDEDLTEWKFEYSEKSNNRWYIGEGIRNRGEKSLYISSDGGITAGYGDEACGVPAYITLDLEPLERYDISFDWKMRLGSGDTLFVAIVDDMEEDIIVAIDNEMYPNYIRNARYSYGLESSETWQNYNFTIRASTKGICRLVFFWSNNKKDSYSPGACIDNLQIDKQNVCPRPDSLRIEYRNGTNYLTWSGDADAYELHYKEYFSDNWDTITSLAGNYYPLASFEKGVYSFWIRSICGADTSMWKIEHTLLITQIENNCINFTDLYSKDVVATSGTFEYPEMFTGVVDHGFNSKLSSHTVHFIPDEYDFNTGYQLRTIPEGEIASVRLGNWGAGALAESITYSYEVDKSNEILLLKYAVVLEDPNHKVENQPQFTLEILNEKDSLIDETCGSIFFYAKEETGWNTYDERKTPVRWKDWTQLGLNLKEHVGQKIKIKLTTYDCRQEGHFGYAYFTLDCSPGELSGLTCGENRIDSIMAPEGFNYEWYKLSEPNNPIHFQRVFYIDQTDTATYRCKIISTENADCYFYLDAYLKPHYPVADFDYIHHGKDCQNTVSFNNLSRVKATDGKIINREIDFIKWDFGNGQISNQKNPTITFDQNGGVYEVTLVVGIVNNLCTDTITYTIEIPRAFSSSYEYTHSICEGESYPFNGTLLTESGVYKEHFIKNDGCDSIVTLYFTVHPVPVYITRDTICHSDTYYLNGKEYTTSGTFDQPHKTISDCDSIIRLELLVLPEITFTLNTIPVTEGNDGAILIQNAPDNYTYTINGVENGPLENLSSGEYTIILIVEYENKICQSQPQTVEIARECLIVETDMLALNYCPDDNNEVVIPYTIHQGGIDRYSITFTSEGNSAGFENMESQASNDANTFVFPIPEAVTPGHYTVVVDFPGQACEVSAMEIPFTVYYSAGIISQRWNDVLAVKSPLYNGGYSFSYYQWYKDNTPLTGENKSYLFEPAGLDLNSVYTVELIRMGETESVMSCGVSPEALDVDFQLQDNTASAGGSYRMTSSQNGSARIYSLTGVIISEQNFSTGINNIKAPDAQGYYILQIKFKDNTEKTFQINVGN